MKERLNMALFLGQHFLLPGSPGPLRADPTAGMDSLCYIGTDGLFRNRELQQRLRIR